MTKTILLIPRVAMYLKATDYYGLTEIVGEENNPEIMQWFYDLGHTWVQSDETAWCTIFINWIARDCGCEFSSRLDARSWLNIGRETTKPQLGNIVVFWRENPQSWKGHVGLFISHINDYVYCLGGNQNNQVNIKPYPAGHVLGYRTLEYM